MAWSKWPYWIKGIVIAGIAYIAFAILTTLISRPLYEGSSFMQNLINYPQIMGTIILFSLGRISFAEGWSPSMSDYIILFISNFCFYVIIGAIIGLIVGKIKNK